MTQEKAAKQGLSVDFRDLERYPRLLAEAHPNEKCLPCLLCQPVCPGQAIKVTFNKSRENYGPLRTEIKGKINVDRDRCNLCGRCAAFCKAFLLVDRAEREKDPSNLIPYEQLLIDEELCDYCGLCVPICPEEAIAVEAESLLAANEDIEFKGDIKVDQDLCIGCGRCAQVCPYEAMDIKKPFEGEIRLVEKNLVRCDPLGCQACFNVCPAKCWYVDERGKAAPVKEQCIFCGACQKACPVSAIEVERSDVRHTEILETPWAEEWKQAVSAIKTGQRPRPDVSGTVTPPEIERPPLPAPEKLQPNPELLRRVDEALSPLLPLLKKPKVRQILEREPADEAIARITDRLAAEIQKNNAAASAPSSLASSATTSAKSAPKYTAKSATDLIAKASRAAPERAEDEKEAREECQ